MLVLGRLFGEEGGSCLKLWPKGWALFGEGRLLEEIRFSKKMDTPESFILGFFFTGKVYMVIFFEGGLAHSRSTLSLKLVAE